MEKEKSLTECIDDVIKNIDDCYEMIKDNFNDCKNRHELKQLLNIIKKVSITALRKEHKNEINK